MNARLADERQYHDQQAADRASTFAQQPHRLRFNDAEYLDHQPWVRPAFAQLGDLNGMRVLDLGCGHGMAAVVIARHGAHVTACDLSPGYCAEAKSRATANEAPISVVACDGEHLPFADESFDCIWGHAILHHLNVPAAVREMRRVLRPGGRVVLCEPWGGNPVWRWIRRWRNHTEGEKPLCSTDIDVVRQTFNISWSSYQWGRYVVMQLN